MSEASKIQRDKLMADLQLVLADTEALLAATAHDASASVTALRGRVKQSVAHARADLHQTQEAVLVKAKEVAQATDGYVRAHPWEAVGWAAGIGLVAGLLMGRR